MDKIPRTRFWVGDIVKGVDSNVSFHADNMGLHRCIVKVGEGNNPKCSIVWVDDEGNQSRYGKIVVRENQLELVRRGNLWKNYHEKEVGFSRDPELQNFFDAVKRIGV